MLPLAKAEEAKLKKDIEDIIKRIEENILYAIQKGKREADIQFGDGHTREPAWEMAVAQLGRLNKAYKFKIDPDKEPRWELKIKW